jgi:hypothetical protein
MLGTIPAHDLLRPEDMIYGGMDIEMAKLYQMRRFLMLTSLVILTGLAACSPSKPQWSLDAKPSEVPFVRLPESVHHVQFYDDGGMLRMLLFSATEDEFKSVFAKFPFREITERVEYVGEYQSFPSRESNFRLTRTSTTAGLYFHTDFKTGGYEEVIYDRNAHRAWYAFQAQ